MVTAQKYEHKCAKCGALFLLSEPETKFVPVCQNCFKELNKANSSGYLRFVNNYRGNDA